MTPRPALWTWPASLALAVLLLGGLVAWGRSTAEVADPPRPLGYYRAERLRPTVAGEAIVLALGSSLTRCALQPDALLTERLRRRRTGARFVRMTSNSLTIERAAQLWPAILAARPRVIVIEANLIRFGRLTTDQWWARHWRAEVRDALRDLPRGRSADIVGANENRDERDDRCGKMRRMTPGPVYRAMLDRWRPTRNDELTSVIASVRAAERNGARVLIFDLPRNLAYDSSFPPGLMRAGARQLDSFLAATRAQRVNGFPPLEPALYADAAHLRPDGQRRVSDFMADRIARLLETRP